MAAWTQMLRDFTAPYTRLESWGYDQVVAPAVLAMSKPFLGEIVASLAEGASVLDVGCGGGQLAVEMARMRSDLHVTGVDLSPDQVDRARQRAAQAGLGVELVVGSALELPFGDAQFDLVSSSASLKHWPDRARGLAECARVLVPGGQLLVVEADRGCDLEDARRFVASWRLPPGMQAVALALFRTWVAGRSLDFDEARALAAAVPGVEARAERVPGMPALRISGVRHP